MKTPTSHPGVAKTNAARYLDGLEIAYEIRSYHLGEEEFSAIAVAQAIGLPAEQVFKTLLCQTHEHEYVFAIVPADAELDFKKLAKAAQSRRVEMAAIKDVQPVTGYVRGGVTIFGARRALPVFVHETLELSDQISVSAGTRGAQLVLIPADYLRAAERLGPTVVADLVKEERP